MDFRQRGGGAEAGLGSFGVVIGGNLALGDLGLDPAGLHRTPILAPGYGEQGAALADLVSTFGPAAPAVVANVGRGVLRQGPQGIAEALKASADVVRGVL